MFRAATEKKEANPKLHICDALRQEGRGCDDLVLWLDCDREGENICFEVLDEVLPVMARPSPPTRQTIHRAKVRLRCSQTIVCSQSNVRLMLRHCSGRIMCVVCVCGYVHLRVNMCLCVCMCV